MKRREFFRGAAALGGLTGCVNRSRTSAVTPPAPSRVAPVHIVPIRAEIDRMFRVTVCLRPFRAAGPRLDVERVGEKTVVHNYGHGGSGWSLSWGSSALAVEKALATGEKDIGVIGCGALGMTSAILLQRAGAKITIYAKERPPDVRSARATGSWTPDSRVALEDKISPDFPALWEKMSRTSLKMYESYLGAPGNPIEWLDRYFVAADSRRSGGRLQPAPAGLRFAHFSERLADSLPRFHELPPGSHPFPSTSVERDTTLTFNIAAYSRQLIADILTEGGRIERREFQTPADLAALPQKTLINCTGYGARALWKDESIVPVRGQIAWLLPQADVHYAVRYQNVYILGRRDGIVIQDGGVGEMEGYNDANEEPDRKAAEAAVGVVASLYSRIAATQPVQG